MMTKTILGLVALCLGAKPKLQNHCPTITDWTLAPLQTSADGGVVAVAVTADDADANDHLRFLWTSASGHFTAPRAAKTEYRCGPPGPQSLSIAVTDDGSTPCATARSFVVTCLKRRTAAPR